MLLLLAVGALAIGNSGAAVMDAFYRGLWMLLPFTMQMALILVLSSTLGAAPVFRHAVARLSRLPRTQDQVFALSCLVVACLAYLYWGLAIALGPLVSIYFAREAEKKGIAVDFPFLLATTAAAGSIWQFGLSASAPLLMNTPGHFLEKQIGLMPLSTTIWAPATFVFITTFFLAIIVAARFLHPIRPQPLSQFPDAFKVAEPLLVIAEAEPIDHAAPVPTLSDRVERSSVPVAILVAAWPPGFTILRQTSRARSQLAQHRPVRPGSPGAPERFQLQPGASDRDPSCWPIVVMYHLYGGVAGLLQFTTLGTTIGGVLATVSTRHTFPFFTALISTVVACFVPSSGGQWVIQGYVTVTAATAIGVSVQQGLLALSIGDQMGNLLTPFWAAVGAGIARIDFRRFIGYQFAYAAIWFVLGVLIFTLL